MRNELLHIFRNTPFGRETLMASVYFCKETGTSLRVYIPKFRQFLMYFEHEVVTVDLDRAFLRDPSTAKQHAEEIIREGRLTPHFIEPKGFTASTLPDLPVDYRYMTSPRTISNLSAKIGLGYIGPRVRNIIRSAGFPVFIPTPVFKPWKKVVVFFGGSQNAIKALQYGIEIATVSGFPLILFTQAEGRDLRYYEDEIRQVGLFGKLEALGYDWLFFDRGELRVNLYEVPHDSLAIVGAYGHGTIREVLFGSKMEEIQTVLPNSMLIIGPNCTPVIG